MRRFIMGSELEIVRGDLEFNLNLRKQTQQDVILKKKKIRQARSTQYFRMNTEAKAQCFMGRKFRSQKGRSVCEMPPCGDKEQYSY